MNWIKNLVRNTFWSEIGKTTHSGPMHTWVQWPESCLPHVCETFSTIFHTFSSSMCYKDRVHIPLSVSFLETSNYISLVQNCVHVFQCSDDAITPFLQRSLLAAFRNYWEILITGDEGCDEKASRPQKQKVLTLFLKSRLQKQKVLTLMSGQVSHCLTVWTFPQISLHNTQCIAHV